MSKELLDALLRNHFGSGYEREESPCCESYNKLISLLYALSELGVIDDVNGIVETLDDISSENAYRDENGELIYDADEIDRRNAYEPAYELYKQDGYNCTEDFFERHRLCQP